MAFLPPLDVELSQASVYQELRLMTAVYAFFIATITAIVVPVSSFCRDLTREEVKKQIEQEEDAAYDYSKFTHPVLKVHAKQMLEASAITPAIIKELAKTRTTDLPMYLWDKFYSKAELQVLARFCELCKRKTRNEIVCLAGNPVYADKSIACWKETANYSETWVYEFGPRTIPIVLYFDKNSCVKAESKDAIQMVKFSEWLCNRLESECLGLSKNQIVRRIGITNLCSDIRNTPISQVDVLNNNPLYFEPFMTDRIEFQFVLGRCSNVLTHLLAH